MAYLPQCTVVVFPVTSVSVFKFTVSIFILKYMHAYFQIVFIAAVYCLFFFLSPCICIFVPSALDAYCLLLAACSCLVLDVLCITYTPQTIISFFFCSHRVKYTCSNILDTINIIIITHLKTKLKKKENGKENGKDNDLHTYIYIYIDRYYAKKENVFVYVYVYVCFYDRTERK